MNVMRLEINLKFDIRQPQFANIKIYFILRVTWMLPKLEII